MKTTANDSSGQNSNAQKPELKLKTISVKKPLDFSKRGAMKKPDLTKKYEKNFIKIINKE